MSLAGIPGRLLLFARTQFPDGGAGQKAYDRRRLGSIHRASFQIITDGLPGHPKRLRHLDLPSFAIKSFADLTYVRGAERERQGHGL